MHPIRIIISNTLKSWLPIVLFFYLPNTAWGIVIKIIAVIWLLVYVFDVSWGYGLRLYGSTGAGFVLNALWFAILNFDLPNLVSYILILLILTGFGTCYNILKKMSADSNYNGIGIYDDKK